MPAAGRRVRTILRRQLHAVFTSRYSEAKPDKGAKKPAFPRTLAEQAAALRAALAARSGPASAEELARANLTRVRELLDALRLLGEVRQVDAERFAA